MSAAGLLIVLGLVVAVAVHFVLGLVLGLIGLVLLIA